MLKDTLLSLREISVDFIPILQYYPEKDIEILETLILKPLREQYPEFMDTFHITPQKGSDMAERFTNAIKYSFNELKLNSSIIIGSDTPHLQPSLIKQCVEFLRQNLRAAVLGPSQNGGFYLLGHNRPFIHDIGMIFKRKSSYNELGNVMELLILNKYDVNILPEVTDVDSYDNLKTVRTIIKVLSFTPSETKDYYFPLFTNKMLDLFDESFWINS